MTDPLKFFVIAGEESGDQLGGSLMAALRHEYDMDVEFHGIGGETMMAEGMNPIFPMADLSVMGLAEVIPRLPSLIGRYRQTVRAIRDIAPTAVISIDSPDFGLRVQRKIAKTNPDIARIHYVAPSVWAWRPGRAKKISRYLDHLLCLWPFEPGYFTPHGLSADFVGHPMVEKHDIHVFDRDLSTPPEHLLLMPGSRQSEISRIAPLFIETAGRLTNQFPDLQTALITLPELVADLSPLVHDKNINLVFHPDEKKHLYRQSAVAMAASGTVTCELALAGIPHITGYQVNFFTGLIGRALIHTDYVSLVNILARQAGRDPVTPELLQGAMTIDNLINEITPLINDQSARADQLSGLKAVAGQLQIDGDLRPSTRAARSVLHYLTDKKES